MRLAATLLGLLALAALAVPASASESLPAVAAESADHGLLRDLPIRLPEAHGVGEGAEDGTGPAPVVGDPFGGRMTLPEVGDPQIVTIVSLGALGLLGGILVYGGTRFVRSEDVLANPVRQQIFHYLKSKVGANLKQITDDLNLTTTNAIWHLRKLEDADLIKSKRFNGYKVFYPTDGGVDARNLTLSMTALQNDNAQEVFEFVVSHPGSHQREIARALAVNHGTVRWHLKKLRSADLLTEARVGKISTYYPTRMGIEALQGVAGARSPVPVPHGIDA